MPKVSVIIPTYNRVHFLKSAVSSVLAQTYKDFELLISDDSSTDKTKEYIKSLSDLRVRFIGNSTNRGVAETRNNALKISCGEYICFLDDDDEWLPDKLAKQVEKMDNSPGSIGGIYTGTSYLDLDRGEITKVSSPNLRGNILDSILQENFLVTSSLIFKKECFYKTGLFDTEFKSASDFDMWIRIAQYYEFDFIKEPLVIYKMHPIKITRDYEAVRSGLELLLTKHKELYTQNKRAYSDYILKLGIVYFHNGKTKMGRQAFIRAIWLYPYNLKHYYNFALSMLGTRTYKKVKQYRKKLIDAVRKLSSQ